MTAQSKGRKLRDLDILSVFSCLTSNYFGGHLRSSLTIAPELVSVNVLYQDQGDNDQKERIFYTAVSTFCANVKVIFARSINQHYIIMT